IRNSRSLRSRISSDAVVAIYSMLIVPLSEACSELSVMMLGCCRRKFRKVLKTKIILRPCATFIAWFVWNMEDRRSPRLLGSWLQSTCPQLGKREVQELSGRNL